MTRLVDDLMDVNRIRLDYSASGGTVTVTVMVVPELPSLRMMAFFRLSGLDWHGRPRKAATITPPAGQRTSLVGAWAKLARPHFPRESHHDLRTSLQIKKTSPC